MTDKERAIVMAYTGVVMLTGEKFQIFHEYIERIVGRPIWTHELATEQMWETIKDAARSDFVKLCSGDREEDEE